MTRVFLGSAVVLLCGTTLLAQTPAGTAFSYQGRLTDAGVPATGVYDLQFTLWDAATDGTTVAGPLTIEDVTVTSGLFIVSLDFGPAFTGQARWLAIGVRPGTSTGAFTPLTQRQPIPPAPHTTFSETSATMPWSGLTAMPAGFADGIDNDMLGSLACAPTETPKWTGTAWTCAADNDTLANLSCPDTQIVKRISGAWACGVDVVDASGTMWTLTGNAGTVSGTSFLGTTDNKPLLFRVNNQTAFRVLPATGGANLTPIIIGGWSTNTATSNGATIAGGGTSLYPQSATGPSSFIGGGLGNSAGGSSAVIAGGSRNSTAASAATIGGGNQNVIASTGAGATIAGGWQNQAGGGYAAIPGGYQNTANGYGRFAAGIGAVAQHDGSFVWSDTWPRSWSGPTTSTGENQFMVIANGGIWLGDSSLQPTADLFQGLIQTSTGAMLTYDGTWANASDVQLKEHFEEVDGRALLDQIARLPVTRWNYKKTPGVQHIGPTAQDFQATFALGGSDKTITTLDPAGIALRAIQQLDRENQELRAALDALKTQVTALAQQQQTPPASSSCTVK